jgi:hypothetical protein
MNQMCFSNKEYTTNHRERAVNGLSDTPGMQSRLALKRALMELSSAWEALLTCDLELPKAMVLYSGTHLQNVTLSCYKQNLKPAA